MSQLLRYSVIVLSIAVFSLLFITTATVLIPPASLTPSPSPTATEIFIGDAFTFAVIGDYGRDNLPASSVAALVGSWSPDFVITTGDNNYPDGAADTIDANIGQHYQQFIGDYQGAYGPGSVENRFWPSLGNHDWHSLKCTAKCTGPYFDYFTLPGNERYYAVDYGLVHLFALDSDTLEPDGNQSDSVQAAWLQNALSVSDACYKVVYLHHAPYSSGQHGPIVDVQWPYAAWGADIVMSGHDHSYERLDKSSFPYIVNGAGGAMLYDFLNLGNLPPGVTSVVRYNDMHGALWVDVDTTRMRLRFFNILNEMIDDFTIPGNCVPPDTPTPTPSSTPTPTQTPTQTETPTETNTSTPTSIPEPTPTWTATVSPSATSTTTPTQTSTLTPGASQTASSTQTPTPNSDPRTFFLYLPLMKR